jgi:hypothetical protein
MAEGMDLNLPFPDNFMRYEKSNSSFVSLNFRQPKYFDVGGAFSTVVGQHPFYFSREKICCYMKRSS